MSSDDLLTSLLAALGLRPDDDTLRLHVAGLLLATGRAPEALATTPGSQCGVGNSHTIAWTATTMSFRLAIGH